MFCQKVVLLLLLSVFCLGCGGNAAVEDDPIMAPAADIHDAIEAGNAAAVKVFVSQDSWDPAIAYPGGEPLIAAIKKGNTEIVKILLAAGARVDVMDTDGKKALQLAEESGNAEVVALLRQRGAQ